MLAKSIRFMLFGVLFNFSLFIFNLSEAQADITTDLVGYWSFDDGTAID